MSNVYIYIYYTTTYHILYYINLIRFCCFFLYLSRPNLQCLLSWSFIPCCLESPRHGSEAEKHLLLFSVRTLGSNPTWSKNNSQESGSKLPPTWDSPKLKFQGRKGNKIKVECDTQGWTQHIASVRETSTNPACFRKGFPASFWSDVPDFCNPEKIP